MTSIEESNDECLNFMGKLKSSTQNACEYIKDIVIAISARENLLHKINITHVDMQDRSFNLSVNTLMGVLKDFTITATATQKAMLKDEVVSNLERKGITLNFVDKFNKDL